jgi:hypothetical protein
MVKEDEPLHHDNDDHDVKMKQDPAKPSAYRVEDDNNLEEKDLKRTYLFGDSKVKSINDPGMEGRGMGGENFGKNNLTPSGDDEANPSQNAGYTNAYFRRTEPAEEHPEDSNFVAENQKGKPGDNSDQQKVGEDKGKQNPTPQQDYQEGTADNDGQKGNMLKNPNDNSSAGTEKEHIET